MTPGIGLMKRRLEKEKDAIALAVSGIAKKYDIKPDNIKTLETKYDTDAGDWLRWILFWAQLLKLKKFKFQTIF